MPYCKDGTFYLYHQRDTRNPGPMGEPFGWSLATTTDFLNYKDYGTVIEHGRNDEQDKRTGDRKSSGLFRQERGYSTVL